MARCARRGRRPTPNDKFAATSIDICYPLAWGATRGVEGQVASLCAEAVDAARRGYNILVITDRRMT